jgi:hypothetical protein
MAVVHHLHNFWILCCVTFLEFDISAKEKRLDDIIIITGSQTILLEFKT